MLDRTKTKDIEENIVIESVSVVAKRVFASRNESKFPGNRLGKRARRRKRKTVKDIYDELGPTYFRRAYRMKFPTFKKLARMLQAGIAAAASKRQQEARLNRKRRSVPRAISVPNHHNRNTRKKRYVPNGPITAPVRLACAIRYFAGASPYDLMTTFGIGCCDVRYSVWDVVDAVNSHADMVIQYPTDHDQQKEIARGFKMKSAPGFDCCAGAVDGILIWMNKPSERNCEEAKCSSGKFFCGRKHKFGLNMQAICDSRGRFLDISIIFPGSTSDCLAFEGSAIFNALENGLLADELCLFGDNAYLNSQFMATPFTAVSSGTRDSYNFYHSQLRINIECAFGMFVNRWSILRRCMPMNLSIKRIIAMTMAMAKLHNFCIDESDAIAERPTARDELRTEMAGGVQLHPVPNGRQANDVSPDGLLRVGHHYDDLSRNDRRARERQQERLARNNRTRLPRDRLHTMIAELGFVRPPPR